MWTYTNPDNFYSPAFLKLYIGFQYLQSAFLFDLRISCFWFDYHDQSSYLSRQASDGIFDKLFKLYICFWFLSENLI